MVWMESHIPQILEARLHGFPPPSLTILCKLSPVLNGNKWRTKESLSWNFFVCDLGLSSSVAAIQPQGGCFTTVSPSSFINRT